jgi:hypothetical protein
MPNRLVLTPGFNTMVANRYAAPAVDRALDRLQDAARRYAPPTRTWVTVEDDRVRSTHRDTHGQEIPGNLRFMLPKLNHQPGHDLARHPRDPDLPIGQSIHCRCTEVEVSDGLARSIHRGLVTVEGTRVTGEVGTRFPRAAESEHGTSGDQPAYFMRRAIMEVAARTPGTQQR